MFCHLYTIRIFLKLSTLLKIKKSKIIRIKIQYLLHFYLLTSKINGIDKQMEKIVMYNAN